MTVTNIIYCANCANLKIVNSHDLYARCEKTGLEFKPFQLDTRKHFCGLGTDGTEHAGSHCLQYDTSIETCRIQSLGEWLETSRRSGETYCSVCGFTVDGYCNSDFCPNCGAVMDSPIKMINTLTGDINTTGISIGDYRP